MSVAALRSGHAFGNQSLLDQREVVRHPCSRLVIAADLSLNLGIALAGVVGLLQLDIELGNLSLHLGRHNQLLPSCFLLFSAPGDPRRRCGGIRLNWLSLSNFSFHSCYFKSRETISLDNVTICPQSPLMRRSVIL